MTAPALADCAGLSVDGPEADKGGHLGTCPWFGWLIEDAQSVREIAPSHSGRGPTRAGSSLSGARPSFRPTSAPVKRPTLTVAPWVIAAMASAAAMACSDKKSTQVGDTVVGDSGITETVAGDSVVGDSVAGDSAAGDSTPGDDEVTTCTAGATGCACRVGGGCDDGLLCSLANLCVPAGSCDGRLGCACSAGACDSGLVCASDVCTVANGVLLALRGGDARACDLAVTTTGRRVAAVVFPDGIRGHRWTRDTRTTIALMRSADEALGGPVAAIVFEGDGAAASALVSDLKVTCYDRHGAPDTAAAITVQ